MCNNQKGFRTVFAIAMVTLLSCCFSPVSSYFALPRVTRTSDAIIIDCKFFIFLFLQFENWLETNILCSSYNLDDGVGYSPFSLGRGYGEIVDPGFVPLPAFQPYGLVQPQPMFYSGWYNFGRQAVACGKGPTTFPTSRALASERIAGGTAAKKGAWPFMV